MVAVSVIIPTFDRLSYLKAAVESVLNQSYQDFELIIVDDGSNDDTEKFVEKLGSGVKYFYQKNHGVSFARNRGIREAQGHFVTFLDSDDLWLENKLELQMDLMESHPDAMVCYTDEIWIRKGVRVNPKKKHKKHSGWIFEYCLPLCIVSPSSVLMRREFFYLIGYFDENLPACEDYDLWLRASLKMPFHFIPEKLIIKRGGHQDQLSTAWGLDRFRIQALIKLLENETLNSRQRELVIEIIKEKAKILEQGFGKRGKQEEADIYNKISSKFNR